MKTVNTFRNWSLLPAMLIGALLAHGQQPPTIGILYIEGRGVIQDPNTIGGMARIEMEKTGRYNVLDWYDVRDVLKSKNVDLGNCFGKTCVLEAGRLLQAEKMFVGSVERYGERIAINLKVLDVATGETELFNTSEYRNLQPELQRMMEVSVKRLLGIAPDPKLTDNLISFNEPIESPVTKVNLSGPRIGCFYTSGIAGERLRADKVPYGGFGMYTVSSMIGWQQEIQYLSSGNVECLFEFLFTGSGLESGRFIPGFTFLNGVRLNRQGWEVALGPTFRVVRKADGYYTMDETGHFDPVEDWHLEKEWNTANGPNPYPIVSNLDSRGVPVFNAGLVLALGKTFRSGQLNIPVNAYVIPRKDGTVYGMTMGFNVFQSTKH